jgi:hypothetical protein
MIESSESDVLTDYTIEPRVLRSDVFLHSKSDMIGTDLAYAI